MMNYEEAVKLAKAGKEEGYQFLYEQTYKSKYYIARGYMKDEESAKDVMQEAYLKAFTHLDKLNEPVNFPSWFGTIVANTAKNMLAKKNPILFSDINAEEDFIYEVEDENVSYQPEIAYTKQETQQLVHELIDTLSEEQRLCILMFHIEGLSIQTIASILDCSENTVKSRLNYGRKNIKKKAEELQKKGYKLYTLAPITLLLSLLRQEEAFLASEGVLSGEYYKIEKKILLKVHGQTDTLSKINTEEAIQTDIKANDNTSKDVKTTTNIKTSAVTSVPKGGIKLFVGKIVVTVIVCCVIGGTFSYVSQNREMNVNTNIEKQTETQTEIEQNVTLVQEMLEEEQNPSIVELKDDDYPTLISGHLTKEELEFVLAYGPEEIPEEGFDKHDMEYFVNAFCNHSSEESGFVEYYGLNANWKPQFSLKDVNRLLLSFTDFIYTEENDTDTEYGLNVEGNILLYVPATLNYTVYTEIISTEYKKEEIKLYFIYHHAGNGESVAPKSIEKVATLKPTSDGMYRIVKIEEKTATQEKIQTTTEEIVVNNQNVKSAYAKVLQAIQNGVEGYTFENVNGLTGVYEYFLYDINADGIEELIVGAEVEEDVFLMHHCRVYTYDESSVVKQCNKEFLELGLYLAKDGSGLYYQQFSRTTGKIEAYRIILEQNNITMEKTPTYAFIMGDADSELFKAETIAPEWKDISEKL